VLQKFNRRRQNKSHKAAKLALKVAKPTHKAAKLAAKVCTAHSKKFFLHTQKISYVHTAKIAISTFSHTLGILLSFGHTFKYFGILSQLLAHCADLSKSEGQLCCCHENSLKPVLFVPGLQNDLANSLKYVGRSISVGTSSTFSSPSSSMSPFPSLFSFVVVEFGLKN